MWFQKLILEHVKAIQEIKASDRTGKMCVWVCVYLLSVLSASSLRPSSRAMAVKLLLIR